MAGLLYRLGRLCANRAIVVVAVWLGLVVLVRLVVWGVGAETSNDLRLPGTESQQATDLLASRFPPQQNGSSPVVFHATKGEITDSANKQAVETSYKALAKAPHVASAPDPFANAASGLVSKDGTTAFTPVLLDIPNGDVTEELAGDILDTTAPAEKAGVEVSVGGNLGGVLSKSPTESSEVVGLLAAMLILALTFGSLVAMGMPIATAVLGLATALGLIGLLGHLLSIPTVGPTLATMIGLGVGIDYALFLVTKHRDQLAQGMERHESIARAVATSGSAIVFAGGTVIIALLSLWVAGIPLVASLGYASAVAVFTAVLAAITLLPAILSLAGRHLFGATLPAFLRPRARPGAATVWLGPLGGHRHRPPAGLRAGRPGPARPPDRPHVLAAPGPGGHRRLAQGHHRAPGLRPHGGQVRARLQRPPADRDRAEPAGQAEQGVRGQVQPGQGEPGRPGEEAEAAHGRGQLAQVPAGLPGAPAVAARGREAPAPAAAVAAAGPAGVPGTAGRPAAGAAGRPAAPAGPAGAAGAAAPGPEAPAPPAPGAAPTAGRRRGGGDPGQPPGPGRAGRPDRPRPGPDPGAEPSGGAGLRRRPAVGGLPAGQAGPGRRPVGPGRRPAGPGRRADAAAVVAAPGRRPGPPGGAARPPGGRGRPAGGPAGAAAAIIMISVFGSFILNGDPTIKQFGVGLSVAVLLASAMVLSLAPAMLTLFGRAVWWLPGWLARLLPRVDIEGQPEPPPTPAPPAAPQPQAGRVVPGTAAWPKPSIPIRETTPPADGNGRVDHVPDD